MAQLLHPTLALHDSSRELQKRAAIDARAFGAAAAVATVTLGFPGADCQVTGWAGKTLLKWNLELQERAQKAEDFLSIFQRGHLS